MTDRLIGIDIGKLRDPSVLTEITKRGARKTVTKSMALPLGLPYPQQADLMAPHFAGAAGVAVDVTGGGNVFSDYLLEHVPADVPVWLITFGRKTGRPVKGSFSRSRGDAIKGGRVTLGVASMMRVVNTEFSSGRVAVSCPERDLLLDEMRRLVEKQDKRTGHVRIEASRGHDDRVMSLAVALVLERLLAYAT